MTDTKSEKENRDPAKKRSIIRGIVIVFLVILLILTFFSNTIMNKSLAQVTTSAVTSGKLTERIRGNGTVEPQQSYEVTVSESATIDTIMVKKGQEIKKGDVLFTVVGSTSDELSNAQEKLRNAELNYQQELLNQKNADEQQNDEIKKAQTELNEAIEKRDEAASNESYNNELKNAKAISESALKYQKNIQTNLSSTISAIDMDDYSMAAPEYTGDINLLKSRAEDAERVYEMALNANSEDVAEKEAAMNEAKNITANYIKNTYAHGATNAILAKWTFDGSYSVSDGTGTEKIYMPTGGNFTPVGEISTTYGTTIPTIRPDYCVGSYSDYAMTLKCDDDKNWSLGQFFNTSSNYCLFFNNDNATEWTVSDYTDPAKYNNKNYFEASFPTTDFESMKINFSPCANNESTHMTYGVVYSLDGSTWTSLGTVRTDENNDGTGGNGWNNFYDREISLPAAANHQDKVYVRIIRYSTSEQNQDNKIKYFTVKGTVKYKVALNENTNYTPVAKTADVTLTRTINADKWSTIVLPFALTAEQVTSTFGTNVKVAQFTAKDENTVTMSSVTVMNANEPYMIKVTGSEYTSPVAINGVTIVTGDKFVRHDNFTFQGVYASGTIPNGAYFVKNNQLYVSNGSSTIKPFRAYFTSDAGYAHDLTLVFDDNGDVTSICTLKADGTIETIAEGKVYDLQGRHIAQPTKGLYIVNGKKVVIK